MPVDSLYWACDELRGLCIYGKTKNKAEKSRKPIHLNKLHGGALGHWAACCFHSLWRSTQMRSTWPRWGQLDPAKVQQRQSDHTCLISDWSNSAGLRENLPANWTVLEHDAASTLPWNHHHHSTIQTVCRTFSTSGTNPTCEISCLPVTSCDFLCNWVQKCQNCFHPLLLFIMYTALFLYYFPYFTLFLHYFIY